MTDKVLGPTRESARKALHLVFAGVPVALAAGADRDWLGYVLVAFLVVAIAIEVTRARSPRVEAVFVRWVGPLLRDREQSHWTGATWLILVLAASVWLLPRPEAITVTWAAAIGDAAAALIGTTIGGAVVRRASPHDKSVEGSVACLVATFVGAYWLAGLGFVESILAAAAAAVAERPMVGIDDNVRIGAAVAAVVMIASVIGN